MNTRLASLPRSYADVPLDRGKWSRITTRLDTGEVTWAFRLVRALPRERQGRLRGARPAAHRAEGCRGAQRVALETPVKRGA